MFLILPIRTETAIRRTPHVNYVLIGANLFFFILFNLKVLGEPGQSFRDQHLIFVSAAPSIYQFFTYQFLHADVWHLFGNMLFLWVFGNSVNGKMGDLPYLCFYLAGGIFAAWAYAFVDPSPFQLLGASGSIAAVTTAYLALFPRSRVTLLLWIIFIHFIELPAMVIICLKIIAWDNIIAPSIGGAGHVAYTAHLAGYLFGFASALILLLLRALPRDQFDMLALWKRWNQRREMAAALADPAAAARARFGAAGRVPTQKAEEREAESRQWDKVASLRTRVVELLQQHKPAEAATAYEELMIADPKQCLSELHQLDLARQFYSEGRSPQAAAAFERYLAGYPHGREADQVRLLLGIIYARDLRRYETADEYLTQSLEKLHDPSRRAQCLEWLNEVREGLGRPAPNA